MCWLPTNSSVRRGCFIPTVYLLYYAPFGSRFLARTLQYSVCKAYMYVEIVYVCIYVDNFLYMWLVPTHDGNLVDCIDTTDVPVISQITQNTWNLRDSQNLSYNHVHTVWQGHRVSHPANPRTEFIRSFQKPERQLNINWLYISHSAFGTNADIRVLMGLTDQRVTLIICNHTSHLECNNCQYHSESGLPKAIS